MLLRFMALLGIIMATLSNRQSGDAQPVTAPISPSSEGDAINLLRWANHFNNPSTDEWRSPVWVLPSYDPRDPFASVPLNENWVSIKSFHLLKLVLDP